MGSQIEGEALWGGEGSVKSKLLYTPCLCSFGLSPFVIQASPLAITSWKRAPPPPLAAAFYIRTFFHLPSFTALLPSTAEKAPSWESTPQNPNGTFAFIFPVLSRKGSTVLLYITIYISSVAGYNKYIVLRRVAIHQSSSFGGKI